NQFVLIAFSAALAGQAVTAAAEPREVHQRVVNHLQAVRDVLVPAPVVQFVESIPPVALVREHVFQVAQAEPQRFEVGAPPPGAPGAPIDPNGIANWAESFAVSTTQGVLDQIFPRGSGGSRRPVVVGGDPKNISALTEDLNVMMRILEKAASAKADGPATAAGIELFSVNRATSPRAFYLDGYGAMFVLNVKYPLLAPPRKDEQSHTNETNTEWERAKEEVYGRRTVFEDVKAGAAPGEEFDEQRVEDLKNEIIKDLGNAKNIRNLKSDDFVTVVVLGSGPRSMGVVRRETRSANGRRVATADAGLAGGEAGTQTTLTLRAKKSDIDAFSKGKLDAEEFRKKVAAQVY
ncbi:MAG TPA: hypothetical protein VK846_09780, partial [Candidatus Limnocylindria bacterium]|nr:hypothetical protein [Candidatus Limnocylindria bacterium]